MTQALQLLTVVIVGLGLAWYGLIRGRKERQQPRFDPRQQALFPSEVRERADEHQFAAR